MLISPATPEIVTVFKLASVVKSISPWSSATKSSASYLKARVWAAVKVASSSALKSIEAVTRSSAVAATVTSTTSTRVSVSTPALTVIEPLLSVTLTVATLVKTISESSNNVVVNELGPFNVMSVAS